MRQTGAMRYLLLVALMGLTAACGQFPGMRTSMPPVPAETPPGTVPPGQAQAPPADLAQQVQNLQIQVQQMENRLAQLEGHPAAPAAARPHVAPAPSTSSSPRVAPKPVVSEAAAEKSYTEGMRHYHAKKYGEARTQLYKYLKAQPKGTRAAEARYYLADSFYQEAKYQEAAVEFNKLRTQFPKSILAPAGMLRQALCYKSQQQMSAYRSTLSKLVKAYPASPEAREAQKMLKEGAKPAKEPAKPASH
jgi:TolA-binding protein